MGETGEDEIGEAGDVSRTQGSEDMVDVEFGGGFVDGVGDGFDEALSDAEKACGEANRSQAEAMLAEASERGLSLQVYLVPDHAAEILGEVCKGTFASPEEAIFVLLGEMLEMRKHVDLRREALRRSFEEAMEGPFLEADDVFANLRERARNWREPPTWTQVKTDTSAEEPQANDGPPIFCQPT